MPDLIGQTLGRYHILEQLGEGGMATVYKAYDTRLERDAAVKVIRRGAFPAEQTDNILKRFEREAKALARLTHPNIVSVIDYGEHEGTPYLVMAYLPGGTLKQKLGKPMPWQEAVRLLLPIARALQFAHSQNIVHRDVKPSNILITLSGEPMLTDFGIAKILGGEGGQTLTGTGTGIGTPEYMAPEQWTGQASPLSDLYSLGVVLYELVAGRKPYIADTPAAVLLKQINDPLPRPAQFAPDLPEAVEKLLLKALAKEPENRYPGMEAMAAAMQALLAGVERTMVQAPVQESAGPAPALVESTRTALAQPVVQEEVSPVVPKAEEKAPSPKPVASAPIRVTRPAGFPRKLWLPIVIVVLVLGIFIPLGIWLSNLGTLSSGSPNVQATNAAAVKTVTPTRPPRPTATLPPIPTKGLPSNWWKRPADGMVMVYVPEGAFSMGSQGNLAEESPVHKVFLDAYWFDQTEVTNAMYALCVADGVCPVPAQTRSKTRSNYYGNPQFADFPVIYVNWQNASEYCHWAGARLPTEAEWEKAASWDPERQIQRLYPWGNPIDCSFANYDGCLGDTNKVGSYPPGASFYGALDMAGNVWEWLSDWYSETYYSQSLERNPGGPPTGTLRTIRGNSWKSEPIYMRSAIRGATDPMKVTDTFGFRCARSLINVPGATGPTNPITVYARIHSAFGSGAIFRSQPGGGNVLGELPNDSVIKVLPDSPVTVDGVKWVKIRTPSGRDGWVMDSMLVIVPPTPTP